MEKRDIEKIEKLMENNETIYFTANWRINSFSPDFSVACMFDVITGISFRIPTNVMDVNLTMVAKTEFLNIYSC